jgi:uncharacterized protein
VVELLRKKTSITKKGMQVSTDKPVASFIQYAAAGDVENLARRIKEGGADIDMMDADGRRAIIEAAKHEQNVILFNILGMGADIDSQDANGMTSLWWACWKNAKDIVRDLLGQGAKTEIADNEGQTPLSVASLCGNDDIVDMLLKHGANPNSSVVYGMTPLLFAADEGHFVCVQLLVGAGADVGHKLPDGETALSLARSNTYQDIVEFLERHQAQKARVSCTRGCPKRGENTQPTSVHIHFSIGCRERKDSRDSKVA